VREREREKSKEISNGEEFFATSILITMESTRPHSVREVFKAQVLALVQESKQEKRRLFRRAVWAAARGDPPSEEVKRIQVPCDNSNATLECAFLAMSTWILTNVIDE